MITSEAEDTRRHDLEQAAQLIGVSEITLRRMAKNREISFIRVGSGRGRYVFLDSHIADYFKNRTFEAEVAVA